MLRFEPFSASPLSDVPPTPFPLEDPEADGRLGEFIPEKVDKAKRRPRDKKHIIDDVTELQNESQSNRGRAAANVNPLNTDTTTITSKQHYLPRSSIVMRLLEIRDNPINYFLPTQLKVNSPVFSVAPPGLTPELAQLFARSMPTSLLKRKGLAVDESPSKRSRRGEVELPRRAESQAPSDVPGNLEGDVLGFDGGISFGDQSARIDDFQLGMPEGDQALGEGREKSVVTDRSRQSSLAPGADYEEHIIDGSCPVAIFDVGQPSQTQPQGGDKDLDECDNLENDKGYSKNTIKALGLMRNELQPDGDEIPQVTMSFKKMTTNVRSRFSLISCVFAERPYQASRRAASSFFFELLVLGTRDCIQVSQKTPFADIRIQAKGRLWEHQQYFQRNLERLSEPPMA
jgi:cohesin complex subunit SCC1